MMIVLRAPSSCLTTLGGAVLAVVLAYCLASVFNPDMQAHAAEPHPFSIRDLTAVQRAGDLSVSPNGQLAAFTVRKWVRRSRTRPPHTHTTARHTPELLPDILRVKEWHEHDEEPAQA
jgi:hypothetical protein